MCQMRFLRYVQTLVWHGRMGGKCGGVGSNTIESGWEGGRVCATPLYPRVPEKILRGAGGASMHIKLYSVMSYGVLQAPQLPRWCQVTVILKGVSGPVAMTTHVLVTYIPHAWPGRLLETSVQNFVQNFKLF